VPVSRACVRVCLGGSSHGRDKICNVVSLQGEIESSEVKGQVKAQLSGLAAKLADVGVSGTGSINNEQYQNVLRQDLAFKRRPAARAEIRVRGYPSPRRSHRGSIGSGNNISAGSPILLVRPTQTLANLVASGGAQPLSHSTIS